jgi:chromosome segregation ATPase
MDAILERMQLLETRVREALAEIGTARGAREMLESKIRELEGEIRSREQALAALRAERERDAVELTRLRTERDEIRAKVEGLLGEIGRLEGALQTTGTAGGSA